MHQCDCFLEVLWVLCALLRPLESSHDIFKGGSNDHAGWSFFKKQIFFEGRNHSRLPTWFKGCAGVQA
jgi:hypothetical protein